MTILYNENDAYAAAWLRNLIAAGVIAPGVVDERSIEDLEPAYVQRFTQVHLFAGIGVWSYSLRRAGWPDSRRVWTISCPCQPFSAAGKGGGFDDERHLWPHVHYLIALCRPPEILGEQVANKDAEPWIDLVCADVEALGYPFGTIPFPAAGVGAPHIRDRAYWMAYDASQRLEGGQQRGQRTDAQREAFERGGSLGGLADGGGHHGAGRASQAPGDGPFESDRCGDVGGLADGHDERFQSKASPGLRAHTEHDAEPLGAAGGMGHPGYCDDRPQGGAASAGEPETDGPANQPGRPGVSPSGVGYADGQYAGWNRGAGLGPQAQSGGSGVPTGDQHHGADVASGVCRVADLDSERRSGRQGLSPGSLDVGANARWIEGFDGLVGDHETGLPRAPAAGPAHSLWADSDWCFCRDAKWRPVEPSYVQVVDGPAGNLGLVCPDWLPAESAEEIMFHMCLAEARGDDRTVRALLGEPVEGSWHLVQPFPLAQEKPPLHKKEDWHLPVGKDGFGNRMGRLRGYGNALTVGQAETFVRMAMEILE